ncbi:CBS domain-containing protein [Melioribacteraceae bacterium 4301-Me]|uniref:CBS domain-containing protein n=1 Tax=Pyranulibacter aquaticus TaxID=3163344 RepID=UPI00359A3A60
MKTVKHILKTKGNAVWTVNPNTKVFDALKLMAEKNIGAVVVVENNQLKGILSERDYARKVALEGLSSHEISVEKIMSNRIFYVNPNTSVEECMALMTEKRIRHLPVLENEKLVGLISIGDVVKEMLDDKNFVISQLEQYIIGSR